MHRQMSMLVMSYLDLGDKRDRLAVRRGLLDWQPSFAAWRGIEDGTWLRDMKIERVRAPWSELTIKIVECVGMCDAITVNGRAHSVDDQPAVTDAVGARLWYRHGDLHREPAAADLPAIEDKDEGTLCWYRYGKPHRDTPDDLPAVIATCGGGCRRWYKRGRLHRDGDLPR